VSATYDIPDEDLDRFSSLIERTCGLVLGREKAYLFSTRLSQLMIQTGCSTVGELYEQVSQSPSSLLLDRVIDAMTTQETTWFRDDPYWTELARNILPTLARTARNESRRLQVWSAACSTGQEPYSLAMLAHEDPAVRTAAAGPGNEIVILATDVSDAALAIAKNGAYSRIAMHRGNLGKRRDVYFSRDGNVWTVIPEIRRLVQFSRFNLKDPIIRNDYYDLVLCRYVLVYFSQEFRRRLLDRLYRAMRPGAILVLGASEGIYGDSENFTLVKGEHCIYYQR